MTDVMLMLHFVGLAMGLGTSFAHMFLGIASAKMEPEEARQFRLNTLALSRMGHIGLGLLVVTGVYLIIPYLPTISKYPFLIIKLVLVLVLGALIGMIGARAKKAREGDAEIHFQKIETLGKLSMITALTIVVMAVLSFH